MATKEEYEDCLLYLSEDVVGFIPDKHAKQRGCDNIFFQVYRNQVREIK
ncbi:MAG: hypothetical protein ACRCTZ_03820 [Sarcina sp.]